jgi:putative endopeptidase
LWVILAACAAAVAFAVPSTAGNDLASDDGLYPQWLDRSVSPGLDFFSFANGGWIKAHPIPADRSYWGVDSVVERDNQTFIRSMVESLAAKAPPPGSAERKIADFYLSGMDEGASNAAGIAPLTPELQRIEAITGIPGLLQEFDHLQMLGLDAPWQIGQMQDFKNSTRVIAVVAQGGLGLPNRDYYLSAGPTFERARAAYVLHIARTFVLIGESQAVADAQAKAVMALETRLAKVSMSDVEQRDPRAVYHVMSLDAASSLTPHLRWRDSFATIGHPELETLNVGMPDFFKGVDREIAQTPLETWKAYLRWQLTDSFAPYLSQPFVDEQFRMTQVLTGAEQLQPRWLRVLRAEDDALGFAIGKLYVEQRFPPTAKTAAMNLVLKIRDALREDLATLAWMTPATRAAALEKLDLMELRVGYPDRWRDYSGLAVDRGPFVLNVMRAKEFEQQRQFAKIGRPVDRNEWGMTPQTVNAYYDPSMNSLNIPAGILQAPYFSVGWPDAANYGATGATVGHEMTHGFDDEGAKFDGHGNLVDWWAPSDLKKFREATACIAQQFSQLTVSGGLHVQGDLVTGEATADLGGLILAFRAFQSLAKPTESSTSEWTPNQRFFIAYAHSWAGSVRPEQAQEMVTTDPHPPADDRTNATLANVPAFQTTFTPAPAGPMVKLPRCVIW